MDVLSDVIAVMRTGEPRSARVERHAPWGRRFRYPPGTAGFEVVLAGSYWLIPPDRDPIPLGTGDVLFLPHGGEYGLTDTPTARFHDLPSSDARVPAGQDAAARPSAVVLCGAYQLDADRGHPLLAELPGIVHIPASVGRHSRLRAAVDLLGAELQAPGQGSAAVVPSLLDTLLVYVLRTWLEEQPTCGGTTGWAAALADPAVSTALDAIHGDPAQSWTVAELAAHAGLSRAAFARRFNSLVGRPPLAYLTWWRLTEAARLLRDSDAPLNAVAERVGYTSEYAFANAFKRAFTIAPGQYRRKPAPHP
ncbi:AraC family transcriptional regulator [Actinomadura sp. NTSP31]|uniref:AraC family transcriptional regulator n=1 Tax=Actinomadura sp. NTSP31 TaxID=1735447 RepID=UPI0035C08A76